MYYETSTNSVDAGASMYLFLVSVCFSVVLQKGTRKLDHLSKHTLENQIALCFTSTTHYYFTISVCEGHPHFTISFTF